MARLSKTSPWRDILNIAMARHLKEMEQWQWSALIAVIHKTKFVQRSMEAGDAFLYPFDSLSSPSWKMFLHVFATHFQCQGTYWAFKVSIALEPQRSCAWMNRLSCFFHLNIVYSVCSTPVKALVQRHQHEINLNPLTWNPWFWITR